MFNKAAKNIQVDSNEEGDIKVLMKMDKSELSTKKMRKKMMKQIRSKLYSNFVRAGTMTGGKMEEDTEKEEQLEVVKDLSKIKELSDDQLVEACGGLTAHKGGRHGLNMKAKLDRIAEAEREFLVKYGGGVSQGNSDDTQNVKKKKKRKHKDLIESVDASVEPKKKKKKKDKCPDEIPVTELSDNATVKKKKKKQKKSSQD